jgi:hypothetical protein
MIEQLEQRAMARLRGAEPIGARAEPRSARRGSGAAVRRRIDGRCLSPLDHAGVLAPRCMAAPTIIGTRPATTLLGGSCA